MRLLLVVASSLCVSASALAWIAPSLVSSEARACFQTARQDADQRRFQAALARFESLILPKPVSVGVDYASIPAGATGFVEGVSIGVDIWDAYLEGSPFQIHDGKGPQVTVRFVDAVPGGADLQGLIEARHEYAWSKNTHQSSLSATLYISSRVGSEFLSRNQVAQIVAHELGHLLGLSDTNDAEALMGPFNPFKPVMSPTREELAAIRGFRDQVRTEIARIQRLL